MNEVISHVIPILDLLFKVIMIPVGLYWFFWHRREKGKDHHAETSQLATKAELDTTKEKVAQEIRHTYELMRQAVEASNQALASQATILHRHEAVLADHSGRIGEIGGEIRALNRKPR